eukprot:1553763-Amphidinium_carterae.1
MGMLQKSCVPLTTIGVKQECRRMWYFISKTVCTLNLQDHRISHSSSATIGAAKDLPEARVLLTDWNMRMDCHPNMKDSSQKWYSSEPQY